MEVAEIGGVIIALVQLAKNYGVPSKWLPVIAGVLGIFILLGLEPGDPIVSGLKGLVIGLTASGAFGASKSVLASISKKR